MKHKEIFMEYIINKHDRLQEDVQHLQDRLADRDADAVDCLELALARERLIAFEEYSMAAKAILKLSVPDPVTYVSFDTDYARYRIDLERDKDRYNGK